MSVNNQGFIDLPTSKQRHSADKRKEQENSTFLTEYTLLKVVENYILCIMQNHD